MFNEPIGGVRSRLVTGSSLFLPLLFSPPIFVDPKDFRAPSGQKLKTLEVEHDKLVSFKSWLC